jgi:hypothetical protein
MWSRFRLFIHLPKTGSSLFRNRVTVRIAATGVSMLAFLHHLEMSPLALAGPVALPRAVADYGQVLVPSIRGGGWNPALPAGTMLVAEASVNQNCFPAGGKDKVRFSGRVFAVQPESVAQPRAFANESGEARNSYLVYG